MSSSTSFVTAWGRTHSFSDQRVLHFSHLECEETFSPTQVLINLTQQPTEAAQTSIQNTRKSQPPWRLDLYPFNNSKPGINFQGYLSLKAANVCPSVGNSLMFLMIIHVDRGNSLTLMTEEGLDTSISLKLDRKDRGQTRPEAVEGLMKSWGQQKTSNPTHFKHFPAVFDLLLGSLSSSIWSDLS